MDGGEVVAGDVEVVEEGEVDEVVEVTQVVVAQNELLDVRKQQLLWQSVQLDAVKYPIHTYSQIYTINIQSHQSTEQPDNRATRPQGH